MVILQDLGLEESPENFARHTLQSKLDEVLHFQVHEDRIILMVGADYAEKEGRGLYDEQDMLIARGKYELHVYFRKTAFVVHFIPSQ